MKTSIANKNEKISVREKIVLTAHELFYSTGFKATGVDTIIRQAHVTKVTFYRHFPSKNLLILAYLHYRHE
ncbi:TPA: TetR/AcrR family transcriptional regulator, partial [Enterobacter hormaechei]|nr:TetR/AcrR family transcriptional regulator [Enterobacter hormaechei]